MRFLYTGPRQSVSLKTGETKDKDGKKLSKFTDFDLVPDSEVDLPDDNPLVKSMQAQNILTASVKASPTKKGDK